MYALMVAPLSAVPLSLIRCTLKKQLPLRALSDAFASNSDSGKQSFTVGDYVRDCFPEDLGGVGKGGKGKGGMGKGGKGKGKGFGKGGKGKGGMGKGGKGKGRDMGKGFGKGKGKGRQMGKGFGKGKGRDMGKGGKGKGREMDKGGKGKGHGKGSHDIFFSDGDRVPSSLLGLGDFGSDDDFDTDDYSHRGNGVSDDDFDTKDYSHRGGGMGEGRGRGIDHFSVRGRDVPARGKGKGKGRGKGKGNTDFGDEVRGGDVGRRGSARVQTKVFGRETSSSRLSASEHNNGRPCYRRRLERRAAARATATSPATTVVGKPGKRGESDAPANYQASFPVNYQAWNIEDDFVESGDVTDEDIIDRIDDIDDDDDYYHDDGGGGGGDDDADGGGGDDDDFDMEIHYGDGGGDDLFGGHDLGDLVAFNAEMEDLRQKAAGHKK